VDDSYIGDTVFVSGFWDKDGDGGYSVGDCIQVGGSSLFQLAEENTVDVNIANKITATVSGNVICDAHTTGNMYVFISGPSGPASITFPLSEPGPYTCFVYDVPLGTSVYILGTWDADGSGIYPYTHGDYLGWYTGSYTGYPVIVPITLEEENTIDINLSHKYVADISGTVTCSNSQYTSGGVYISLHDGPDPNTANMITILGTSPPLSASSSYQYRIFDVTLGSQVWVVGYWDKDGSKSLSPGDYIGYYSENPITLQQTNTNIDFDVCACHDSDGDKICDENDKCTDSNLESTITIGDCDSGVENQYLEDGCTMSDKIAQCEESAKNHRQFVKCVNRLTKNWMNQGLITQKEKRTILLCAAKSDIP
jgi:hypothetical protein